VSVDITYYPLRISQSYRVAIRVSSYPRRLAIRTE